MARTSSTISSFSIFFSKKFFRRANERKEQTNGFKVRSDASLNLRIGNAPTVPGQQIIHSVNGGDRNVQCILRRFDGNDSLFDQRLRDIERVVIDQEQGYFSQYGKSVFCGVSIAGRAFSQ